MNGFYYLNSRNEVQGPVSINELLELLANGIIQTTTLVARVGDAAWRPLPSVLADMNIAAPCPPVGGAYQTGPSRRPQHESASDGDYHDGMGLLEIFKLTMTRNFANFSGRATRREYWMFQLASLLFLLSIYILGIFLIFLIDPSMSIIMMGLSLLYSLALIIPGLGLYVRRLHDTGRSGWMILLGLIPFIGGWILLIFSLLDSQRGTNAYGPSLKYPD